MVATFYMPGFAMSAVEPLQPHTITAFDSLSVTMQFAQQGSDSDDGTIAPTHLNCNADPVPTCFRISYTGFTCVLVSFSAGSPRMELPLVRGMPYATALYSQLTPFLYTNNAILVRMKHARTHACFV